MNFDFFLKKENKWPWRGVVAGSQFKNCNQPLECLAHTIKSFAALGEVK